MKFWFQFVRQICIKDSVELGGMCSLFKSSFVSLVFYTVKMFDMKQRTYFLRLLNSLRNSFIIQCYENVNGNFHISLPCTEQPAKFSRCQFQAFAAAEICAEAGPPVFALISKYFCKFSFCYMIYAKTFENWESFYSFVSSQWTFYIYEAAHQTESLGVKIRLWLRLSVYYTNIQAMNVQETYIIKKIYAIGHFMPSC